MTEAARPAGIRRLLRLRSSVRSLQRAVDDEIRFHIESRTEELIARGMLPGAARETAEREYGDLAQSREELVAVDRRRLGSERREELIMSMIQDVRYAARGLMRRPALVVVTTLALTIGIAANAVMFGVVDQLLFSPPPLVVDPEGVKRIYYEQLWEGTPHISAVTAYPMVAAMRDNVPALSEVSAVYAGTFSLGRGRDARNVDVQLVSANYFSLLGIRLQMGRDFGAEEDRPPRGAQVAIVSDGFWKLQLGEASDVLGRVLELDGKPFTVIGVAPPGFSGIDRRNIDLWVPVSALASDNFGKDWYNAANWFWVEGIVRLQSNVAPAIVEQQATAAYQAEHAKWNEGKRDTTRRAVLGPIVGTRTPYGISAEGRVSLWLVGVSVIVLLIACANVANLLIARTLQRRREIAVRLALGVSRIRLLRQLLTEAALLAGIGGFAAVLVAYWGSGLVRHTMLPDMVWNDRLLDPRVLGFTLAAAIVCILIAGLAPAIQGVQTNISQGLKSSSRQAAGGAGKLRFGLLVTQAALSLVLLVGAGLFVKSLRNIVGRDVGIDLDRVARVTMHLTNAGFTEARIRETWSNALERVKLIPGVESASLVSWSVPMQTGSAVGFEVPGARDHDFDGGGPYYSAVNTDFFTTLGTRIVRGRSFTPAEERTPNRVLLINETIATAYWPGRNPIGQCVKVGGDGDICTEIIGVVENILLFRMIKDDRALAYVSPKHPAVGDRAPAALLVRTVGDPSKLVPLLRREIQGLSTDMPYVAIRPYSELVAPQLRSWRLGATMFALFGMIALVIAAVGLYSVMAYWVSQRTQEIGVRMALGAQRKDVVGLVARQGSSALMLGLLLGAIAAMSASRWVADMLYETSPRDPLVYGSAALVLILAGLLASVIPARRSAKVDPVIALRSE